MERLVYKPFCGCEVYRIMRSKPNLYRIQYCPLHGAAPDLYEALLSWDELRAMRPLDSGADIDAILNECCEITDKAIAKAEGK